MGATNLKLSLTKRYGDLSGRVLKLRRTIDEAERIHSTLPELRGELAEAEDTLTHIAALMRDIDPDWDAKSIMPVRKHAYSLPWRYGDCTVLAYEILGRSRRWLTVGEVVRQMSENTGVKLDPVLYQKAESNVNAGFVRRLKRGEVERSSDSYPQRWRVVPLNRQKQST